MPLADPVWDRFKSGYKLIQYMAAGRAVVASPVGANLDIVAKAETGFFADTADEWYAALAGLRDDREMCRRLGAAGRQRCADRYSLDAVGDRVVSVFKLAAEHTRQSKRA
jgi:glycosyltransferase involved in cell wall biosynthesis